jgi:metal-dependent amidase/aminoacylase/carboxypeptidase family protein
MKSTIQTLADEWFPDIVKWRRAIHRRPELAREEHETAAFVADRLRELGLDVYTGIYGTGVVGVLRGGQPGPTMLLRADIDALPIREATGHDFASEYEGKMHACGHDAHTACLLGAAAILSEVQEDVRGTLRFCFQPSEEVIPGGAKFMIEEGVLSTDFGAGRDDNLLDDVAAGGNGAVAVDAGVDYVFGQHVRPDLPAGTIGIRPGPFMASADEIHVTIRGEGGHAAAPHELSTDVTYVASQIVVGLQSVVSRNAPPGVPSILTIGRLIADGATNVIPETARIEGTFRTMDESWRFMAHDRIRRVIMQTAAAHGAEAEVDLKVGYPALVNDKNAAARIRDLAHSYTGASRTIDLDPWYAGEDFAYFLQERPGAFFTLGVGNKEQGISSGLHTTTFDIDEEALRTGAGFLAYLGLGIED